MPDDTAPYEQLALWRSDFEADDRAIYVRRSLCVRISPIAPIAPQTGQWRGVRVNAPGEFAAGVYAAKWRLAGDHWRLEAEVFATEECNGDFCPDSQGAEQ